MRLTSASSIRSWVRTRQEPPSRTSTADGRTAALFVALDDGDDATQVRDQVESLVAADPMLSPLDLAIAPGLYTMPLCRVLLLDLGPF